MSVVFVYVISLSRSLSNTVCKHTFSFSSTNFYLFIHFFFAIDFHCLISSYRVFVFVFRFLFWLFDYVCLFFLFNFSLFISLFWKFMLPNISNTTLLLDVWIEYISIVKYTRSPMHIREHIQTDSVCVWCIGVKWWLCDSICCT